MPLREGQWQDPTPRVCAGRQASGGGSSRRRRDEPGMSGVGLRRSTEEGVASLQSRSLPDRRARILARRIPDRGLDGLRSVRLGNRIGRAHHILGSVRWPNQLLCRRPGSRGYRQLGTAHALRLAGTPPVRPIRREVSGCKRHRDGSRGTDHRDRWRPVRAPFLEHQDPGRSIRDARGPHGFRGDVARHSGRKNHRHGQQGRLDPPLGFVERSADQAIDSHEHYPESGSLPGREDCRGRNARDQRDPTQRVGHRGRDRPDQPSHHPDDRGHLAHRAAD